MEFRVLASDYDGTLAHDGVVSRPTVAAVRRLIQSGRLFFMVTGRFLPDLQNAFPDWRICTRIVAENGAILYNPETGKKQLLATRPPDSFINTLRRHGVTEIGLGEVVIGTYRRYEDRVRAAIENSGLPLEMTLNFDTIMILPTGVDKASGLRHALADFRIPPDDVVSVGDAENDHAFLDISGCSVAVANALPEIKEKAHIITECERGDGVAEIIEKMIRNELVCAPPVRA